MLNLDSKLIKKMYESGTGIFKIAKIFNCSISPIRNRLLKEKIILRRRGSKKGKNIKAIYTLRKQGKTFSYIANIYGVSRQAIHKSLLNYKKT
jgi:DNA invertase Pin-like site-specific DNA recombinase